MSDLYTSTYHAIGTYGAMYGCISWKYDAYETYYRVYIDWLGEGLKTTASTASSPYSLSTSATITGEVLVNGTSKKSWSATASGTRSGYATYSNWVRFKAGGSTANYYDIPRTSSSQTATFKVTYTVSGHSSHTGTTTLTIPATQVVTINYNANGGSGTMAATTYHYASTGATTLRTNTFTRTGYNFKGWSLSSTATTATYSDGQSWSLSSSGGSSHSYTLYAVWENAGPYTITYNPKGGTSGEITSQIKTFGNPITIPQAAEPSKEGYTFQGWATSSRATVVVYHTGDSYTTESSATLYAVWEEQNITITFNANTTDAVQSMPADMTMRYWTDSSKTISSTSPRRLNYTFVGWTLTQDGSGDRYQPGDTFYNPRPQAFITLYAQWDTAIINYYYWDNITTPYTKYAVPGSSGDLWSCGAQAVEVPDITINNVIYEFAQEWLKVTSTAVANLTNESFYRTDNYRESYVGSHTSYTNIQDINYYTALYKRKSPRPETTQPYMFFIRTNGVYLPEFIAKTEEQFAQLEDITGNHISGYIRFNSPYPKGTVISCFPNQLQPGITKPASGLLVRNREDYKLSSTISYSISPGYLDQQQQSHTLTGTVSPPVIKGNYAYLYFDATPNSGYSLDEGTQTIIISWDTDTTIVTNDYGVEILLAEYVYNLIGVNFIVDINATGTMLSLGGEAVDLNNQNEWPSTVQNYTQNEHPEQGTSSSVPKLGEPLSITTVQNPFYVLNTDDEFIPAITEGILEDEIVLKNEVVQAWAALLSGGTPSSVTAVPLSVTQNGLYTAPAGYAYTPVTVSVESGSVAHYSDGILILS